MKRRALMFASLVFASLLLALPARAENDLLSPTIQGDIIATHNHWRSAVGTSPVVWADDLASAAQQWADHLAAEKGCNMVHSSSSARQKTGENLYWASPLRWSDGRLELQNVPGKKVVDAWGSEKNDYDEASHRCAPGKVCGHYTQVVWHSTREVGCGKQQCADLSQVWVCRYRPTGNWVGERPY